MCRADDEEQSERMRTGEREKKKNVLLEDLHLFITLYYLSSLKCQIFQLLRWKLEAEATRERFESATL